MGGRKGGRGSAWTATALMWVPPGERQAYHDQDWVVGNTCGADHVGGMTQSTELPVHRIGLCACLRIRRMNI